MSNKYLRLAGVGIVICAAIAFLMLRPAPHIKVGLAKAVPSSLVNTENTDVSFSVSASELYGARVDRVLIDLSELAGEDNKVLEMSRVDNTWSFSHMVSKGIPHGTYAANISVLNSTGAVEAVRKVKVRVLPEKGSGIVRSDNPYYRYQGRVAGRGTDSPSLVWPGNSVEARFRGTSVSARFDNTDSNAIFFAVVDGDIQNPVEFRLKTGDHIYNIASGLEDDWHELKLHRITEIWHEYHVGFKGLELDEGCGILPPQDLSGRKIEFYGDSIVAGNHAEKGRKDVDRKGRANNFLSFGVLTARAFDAEYSCIARSGIALTSRYHPDEATMDVFYKRSVPYSDSPTWDFTSWQPDLVVMHMLTNDDWFWGNSTEIPSDEWFKDQFRKFIEELRGHYPDAHIICVQGPTSAVAKWKPPDPDMVWAIETAVLELNELGDDNVYSLMFEYQYPDPEHPSAWHHENLMAKKLVPFIEDKLGW